MIPASRRLKGESNAWEKNLMAREIILQVLYKVQVHDIQNIFFGVASLF